MYKLEIKPSEVLHTTFGNAKVNDDGYYRITSEKENNLGKFLHRLVWEQWYGKLSPNTHIHHINKNSLDNCIWNLEPMTNSEHLSLHHKGMEHTEDSCIQISKFYNTSGFFRVSKSVDKSCKNGFMWRYQYYENGKKKSINRVKLEDLEKEVKRRNLTWKKLD